MKINAAIMSKKSDFTEKNRIDKNTVTAFLSISSGLIFGCIIYVFSNELHKSTTGEFFVNFSTVFSNKSPIEIFSGLIFYELPLFILILLFGTSVIGKPFICIASALKGSGLGFLASYLYCTYGLKGLEYCLLVFYPGKIILLFSLLLTVKNALGCSDNLKMHGTDKTYIMKGYIISCAIVLLIAFISCVVDFILIISFSSLFSF